MAMGLNEGSIRLTLNELLGSLQANDFKGAQSMLDMLDLRRLLKPVNIDGPEGSIQVVDPAEPFGTERVHEVGELLTSVKAAIGAKDQEAGVEAARKALDRWDAGK
jgi:hypothetical protein